MITIVDAHAAQQNHAAGVVLLLIAVTLRHWCTTGCRVIAVTDIILICSVTLRLKNKPVTQPNTLCRSWPVRLQRLNVLQYLLHNLFRTFCQTGTSLPEPAVTCYGNDVFICFSNHFAAFPAASWFGFHLPPLAKFYFCCHCTFVNCSLLNFKASSSSTHRLLTHCSLFGTPWCHFNSFSIKLMPLPLVLCAIITDGFPFQRQRRHRGSFWIHQYHFHSSFKTQPNAFHFSSSGSVFITSACWRCNLQIVLSYNGT